MPTCWHSQRPLFWKSRDVLPSGSGFGAGASPLVAVLGIVGLIGFAVVLTRIDTAFAGRAYAAYGGIYIVASLFWLWIIEGQRPSGSDLIGAAMAVAGALVIIAFAARSR